MGKDIELYRSEDGAVRLEVSVRGDTVWLSQAQMAELFGKDRSVITKHIRNVFKDGELDEQGNVQKMHIANSDKPVMVYSLDVIISVGYRVKSVRGVQFRRWATRVLRRYLIDGYAVDDQRLRQLGRVVKVLARSGDRLASGIADVVSHYLPGLLAGVVFA